MPGVQVALAGAHLDLRHRHAAQADGDRRASARRPCRCRRRSRSRRRARRPDPLRPRPRCPPPPRPRTSDAHVHGQRALARERAGHVQQRQEVALVVGGAARVDAAVADVGLERRRRPGALVADALHVVVAVDQDRGRVGRARAQLAHGQRVAAADLDELGGAAGAHDALGRPLGRAARSAGSPPPVEIEGMRSQSTSRSTRSFMARHPISSQQPFRREVPSASCAAPSSSSSGSASRSAERPSRRARATRTPTSCRSRT